MADVVEEAEVCADVVVVLVCALVLGEVAEVLDAAVVPPPPVVSVATPLPTDAMRIQSEEEGAGCAGGVTGSPWWNVEVPYTPIGCPRTKKEISNRISATRRKKHAYLSGVS